MQLHTHIHTHTQRRARIVGANVTMEESQQRLLGSQLRTVNGKVRSMTWHDDNDALTVSCVMAVALPKLARSVILSDSKILWYRVDSFFFFFSFQRKKTCFYNNTDVIAAENRKWGVDERPPNRWVTVCVCVCVCANARVCVLVALSGDDGLHASWPILINNKCNANTTTVRTNTTTTIKTTRTTTTAAAAKFYWFFVRPCHNTLLMR